MEPVRDDAPAYTPDPRLKALTDRSYDETAARRLLAKRRRRESRFQWYGRIALAIACAFLVILVSRVGYDATGALRQTVIDLEFDMTLDALGLPEDWGAADLRRASTRSVYYQALYDRFPERTGPDAENARSVQESLRDILPDLGNTQLVVAIRENPEILGSQYARSFPVSDNLDLLYRGLLPRPDTDSIEVAIAEARATAEEEGTLDDFDEDQIRGELISEHYQDYNLNLEVVQLFDALVDQGIVRARINWGLITNPNQNSPEFAGLAGAIVGSFLTLFICMVLAVPIGVMAAIYLEEFAPKNWFTSAIEININNLAAVPSIIFGLLGLAMFIQFFGIPPRTPLVGGMVLALMTLPTIIIASRAALKAVPPSIREAAYGMGASKQQVILHHVLPLSMPGVLTGSIIGLAQALGETAPLLLIGMVTFVTTVPDGFLADSAVLPVQVFLWSDQPQRGFAYKTAAAIIVLLIFLVAMNSLAIWARKKFERRW